ncbi:TIGR02594 family protein [Pseudogemmobacter sp. W21_MBD1_M6]|uniref:TIGR02594 family protein n=1 Tax=Pseudogemmobacter sp. W21_MBD1_M6 TaxID=3240271 RepID=UPI003F9986AF
MTPYDIAHTYIGTTEGPGPADNPKILEMYATIGQDWVEHDDVAWCAAFVGHCLEQAGLRSTRKLTARSYLEWGVPVDLAEAQEGDIVVFRRGSSSWQGHVGFFVAQSGQMIEVLGGNQGDAVSIKRYAASKLLGVRRAGNVAPRVTMSTAQVQTVLDGLGYHEVGHADGSLGSRTRGAILAFRADQDLPLVPIIDAELVDALARAPCRAVSPERAAGMPEGSRIVTAANAQIGLGAIGVAGSVAGSVAGQITPALDQIEAAQGIAARALVLFGLEGALPTLLPWIGALLFAGVIIYAVRARAARIEDYRTGRSPGSGGGQ